MRRQNIISTFAQLGRDLTVGIETSSFGQIVRKAVAANGWFTEEEIVDAVRNICKYMLDRDALTDWIGKYKPAPDARTVGIIMAGNIPLVGFFDLLCVVCSGHRALVKPSSKDRVLTEYICARLLSIDPQFPVDIWEGNTLPQALIATGSDNTVREIDYRFPAIPKLLRGNRFSAAVLTANETNKELSDLAKDIFTYSGLGCRSVSHLMLPDGYEVGNLAGRLSRHHSPNPKYLNNYRQRRALLALNGEDFIDGGTFLMRRSDSPSEYLSEITFDFYPNKGYTTEWYLANESKIQCMVAAREEDFSFATVRAGTTQSPTLYDYPDRIDTIRFLSALQ